MTYPLRTFSISIERPFDVVYKFASNPANFPRWVAFITSMTRIGENTWRAHSDLGSIEMEFAPVNDYGVIDHLVTLPDGSRVNNPMRVIANGEGSELQFVLFWMPGRTKEEYEQDAKLVQSDLETIKRLLEENA